MSRKIKTAQVEAQAQVEVQAQLNITSIMSGNTEAIKQAIDEHGLEVVKQAIVTAQVEAQAIKAQAQVEAQAISEILAMVTPAKSATVSDLASRVKGLYGDAPTQSEFLTEVLLHTGNDLTTAKSKHASILTMEVSQAIEQAYGDKLPDSVTGKKTTWKNDTTTRQRIANHISKPPKFYAIA